MKISLSKWAARNYDPPPHISTLRAWARDGSSIHRLRRSGVPTTWMRTPCT
ncbi:excisionase [Ralstonia mannitolilytica]|uniref:excisionase n=1 Tax=Ralstonia mannitolilytica TaxID=105219 RepID=UPI00292FD68F|nr:excisionase [Ralstonia mannitolilytica]